MSKDFPSYSDRQMSSVFFKITLDGKPMSAFETTLIEEIVFEDTSTGSDLVSVTFHDPDYTVIANPKIVRSTPCKIEAGYMTKYRTWVDGYISAVDVEFPQEGNPVVTVHVMDKSYIMNRVERKRVFKNLTYAGIAQKIAKEYGFSFEGDTSGGGSKKEESVTQSYETDIQFLIGLASEIGYLVYVRESKLYFKDKEKFVKNNSWDTVWYRKPPFDIISFRPRVIQADQLDEVEESDIDSKSKKTSTASAKNS
jgi:phage protein D